MAKPTTQKSGNGPRVSAAVVEEIPFGAICSTHHIRSGTTSTSLKGG